MAKKKTPFKSVKAGTIVKIRNTIAIKDNCEGLVSLKTGKVLTYSVDIQEVEVLNKSDYIKI